MCSHGLMRLYSKVGVVSNRLYELVHRQICVNLNPLAGMTHKRKMKAPVSRVLHTGKFRLEAGHCWIWTGNAIFGAEVVRLVIPLAVDIDNIIELWILRWRLDVFWLENVLNEFIRLRGDFNFQRFRKRG